MNPVDVPVLKSVTCRSKFSGRPFQRHGGSDSPGDRLVRLKEWAPRTAESPRFILSTPLEAQIREVLPPIFTGLLSVASAAPEE